MKKLYIQPALEQMAAEAESIVAVSLQINNTSQDNVSGDVKESDGDWDDLWD